MIWTSSSTTVKPQFYWIIKYLGYIGRQVLRSKERGEGLGPVLMNRSGEQRILKNGSF